MRERLIELLRDTFNYTKGVCIDFDEAIEINADDLLDNGVIVPPCKVGEKVWLITNLSEYEVLYFQFTGRKLWATLILIEDPTIMREINTDYFGKTVFLSREDAEEALKGDEGK